jgi:hypothetical protein
VLRPDPVPLGQHDPEHASIVSGVPWNPRFDQRLLRTVTVPVLGP